MKKGGERISVIETLISSAPDGIKVFPDYAQLSMLASTFELPEFRAGVYHCLKRRKHTSDPAFRVLVKILR
jgi:hypothetical protein